MVPPLCICCVLTCKPKIKRYLNRRKNAKAAAIKLREQNKARKEEIQVKKRIEDEIIRLEMRKRVWRKIQEDIQKYVDKETEEHKQNYYELLKKATFFAHQNQQQDLESGDSYKRANEGIKSDDFLKNPMSGPSVFKPLSRSIDAKEGDSSTHFSIKCSSDSHTKRKASFDENRI
jgi:acetyl/propionyl-CoA carboxylase alpha subunit